MGIRIRQVTGYEREALRWPTVHTGEQCQAGDMPWTPVFRNLFSADLAR
jgi:hypothetical protein